MTLSVTAGASGRWIGLAGSMFPAHSSYLVPTAAERGLADAEAAFDVLHDHGHALLSNIEAFTVVGGDFERSFSGRSPERWKEIAELFRSAGEAGDVAIAGLCETAGLLGSADPEHPLTEPLVAAFMTEATLQYLIGMGHNLANVGLRIAIESPANLARLRANKEWRKVSEAAVPGSSNKAAWIFHSKAKDLAQILGNSSPQARYVGTVARLHDATSWKSANAARDEFFHRWRHGFASGQESAYASAVTYHAATEAAARCMGRAIPSLYYQLLNCYPTAGRGAAPRPRLMGQIQRSVITEASDGSPIFGPMLPVLSRSTFRG